MSQSYSLRLASLFTLLAASVRAQTDVVAEALAPALASPELPGMTIRQIIDTGGWLMYVLGAM